jgi:hypothetical protein
MNISKTLENITQYFSVAMARIFGPTDDKYPNTGVQPFEGETFKESDRANLK